MELNKLYQENCLLTMQRFPDESVDIILTSPPYDKGVRSYNGYVFDFEKTAQGIKRILKQGGVCVWVVNDKVTKGSDSLTSYKQALFFKEDLGLNVRRMIYRKNNFSNPASDFYHRVHEYIFVISKGKPKTFNPIMDRKNKYSGHKGSVGRNTVTQQDGTKKERASKVIQEYGKRHDVWDYNTAGQENMGKKLSHPAMMPLKLAEDLIRSWSNPDSDIVYDPFTGSGTTLVAAKKLNRFFIGSEISSEYCVEAEKRIKNTVRGIF